MLANAIPNRLLNCTTPIDTNEESCQLKETRSTGLLSRRKTETELEKEMIAEGRSGIAVYISSDEVGTSLRSILAAATWWLSPRVVYSRSSHEWLFKSGPFFRPGIR